jgi:uncharacterized protein (TIGR00106 family)
MVLEGYPLKVIIDLCIVPVGVGVSLSTYVAACEKILESSGLNYTLHANGTNIEGDWDAVFATVKKCHQVVHDLGAPRIFTVIKIGTRKDRRQSMAEKIDSVQKKLLVPDASTVVD